MFGCKRLSSLMALIAAAITIVPCLAAPSATMEDASAKQVLQREYQYSAALLHGDARLLASVLADSFVDTSESGVLCNKQQLLQIIAHQTPPTYITETDRKIQIYGGTAVVTVKFVVRGMDHDKPYEAAGRATNVWIKRNSNWYCVAAHSGPIQ